MSDIYHYTNARGLEGIIENQELWATDFRFLNDSGEINYGIDVFEEVYASHKGMLQDQADYVRGRFHSYVEDSSKNSLYMVSFSRDKDLLSLWRGYNSGLGYNIGFAESIINSNFKLTEVIYERSKQISKMYDFFTQASDHLTKGGPDRLNYWLYLELAKTLVCLKHEGFKEEQEVRIVAEGSSDVAKRIVSPDGFKPYIPLKPPVKGGGPPWLNQMITSICIGPALHDRQKDPVSSLLRENKISLVPTKSSIPYIANR